MNPRGRAALAAIGVLLATTAATGTSPAARAADDPWRALLSRVPDEDAYRSFVVLNDYATARDAVDRKTTGDERRDLARLTLDAGMAPSELVETIGRGGDPLRTELGIPTVSIDRDLTAGEPPEQLVVLDGGVERGRVDRATEHDETWNELLRHKRHAGQAYLAWDGEELHLDRRSPVRPLGIGGRLAVDPPIAVWSRTTAAMEASLDASGGDIPSLDDDRTVTRIVSLLRERDAYSMFLTHTPPAAGVDPGGPEPLVTPVMTALGAADSDPQTLIVVLAQATPAEAKDNARRLAAIVSDGTSVVKEQPWRDLVKVDEITTVGRYVVASLRAETSHLWLDVPLTRDSLLGSS